MISLSDKLTILSDAAKHDVSCSSSGSKRENKNQGLGNSSGSGICHSYTKDGRCVSLLKILLTNHCIYDCTYCSSRKSNDNRKAAFSVKEVVDLTMEFYRRNYIEGLFLSSGIFKNADYTMERLVRVAKELRTLHHFNGFIHLKAIPGASKELIEQAGLYADRLSANIELPSERSLKMLAPEKDYGQIITPMNLIKQSKQAYQQGNFKSQPSFVPAGQTTQMIIGASPESDLQILQLADNLYKEQELTRIYYAWFVPTSLTTMDDQTMKATLLRENRLYQADWLMRDYGFSYSEIVHAGKQNLETELDPKLSFALENFNQFPVEVRTATFKQLIRVPGIGLQSAKRILETRVVSALQFETLLKIGVAFSKAKYFITCGGKSLVSKNLYAPDIRAILLGKNLARKNTHLQQLQLLF